MTVIHAKMLQRLYCRMNVPVTTFELWGKQAKFQTKIKKSSTTEEDKLRHKIQRHSQAMPSLNSWAQLFED